MKFSLEDVKADKTNPENVFTAVLHTDGKPLALVTKTKDEEWPDMAYHKSRQNAEVEFNRADAACQALGKDHIYAFVLELYANRQKEVSEAEAAKQREMHLRKLCATALVIKLPGRAEDDYVLSTEVSVKLAAKSGVPMSIATKPGSDVHKSQVRALYAEIMGDEWASKIEFINDRYDAQQGKLQLAA